MLFCYEAVKDDAKGDALARRAIIAIIATSAIYVYIYIELFIYLVIYLFLYILTPHITMPKGDLIGCASLFGIDEDLASRSIRGVYMH